MKTIHLTSKKILRPFKYSQSPKDLNLCYVWRDKKQTKKKSLYTLFLISEKKKKSAYIYVVNDLGSKIKANPMCC